MKKLIIQVPCYNEADSLSATLGQLPRSLPGIDQIAWLVIDDGSDDTTSTIARDRGAEHVIRLRTNRGLARAFEVGILACLELGADIIVNTDGDNQYSGSCIPDLIRPILDDKADIVVGDRDIKTCAGFGRTKRLLHRLGRRMVSHCTGVRCSDPTSGFRAYSRDAALRINLVNDFTHTLETLLSASRQKLKVVYVPVITNPTIRPSRLFKSTSQYIIRSLATIARMYALQRPFIVFVAPGLLLMGFGFVVAILAGIFQFRPLGGASEVPTFLLAGFLILWGLVMGTGGMIADAVRVNRVLHENMLYCAKKAVMDPRQNLSADNPSVSNDS